MNQQEIILHHLEDHYPNWYPGYLLHGLETPYGFIGSRGERNARQMRSEGKLERQIIDNKVYYRVFHQPKQTQLFSVDN